MCEPKGQDKLAMSTEQWCACCVYKLCCAACLFYTTRLQFFLSSTKMSSLSLNGCVRFRKPLCHLRMVGPKDVSNAFMSEIASFFSTSPNAHLFGYAGAKMTSLIPKSTELVRAGHAYKVRCWRVLSTTPILTSFLSLPKRREVRAMAVPVFQNSITWTHDQHSKGSCKCGMKKTDPSLLSSKTFNSESTCGRKGSMIFRDGDDVGPWRMYINTFGGSSSSRIFHTSFSVLSKRRPYNTMAVRLFLLFRELKWTMSWSASETRQWDCHEIAMRETDFSRPPTKKHGY